MGSGVRLTSSDEQGRGPADQANRAPGARPRVYLHIGEPKTGSTFVQHVIWGNRARLADQGVLLPGYTRRDHNRASRDLRGAVRPAADPADPWDREWDVLAGQALRAPDAALISDELLVACKPRQAERAVQSLLSAELHIVIMVRDFAALLPAEWQESIKTRHTVPWEKWLGDVTDSEVAADRRSRAWFWNVHDTLAILSMWAKQLPPDRVHVITMPQHGSADVLWGRFASVIGIDPGGFDLSEARANSSLGLPETEFLRRMNEALPEEIPDWYYTRYLKQILAHGVLAEQPHKERLSLPPGREAWAADQAKARMAALRDAGYHVVGDLDELIPELASGPYVAPDQQSAEQMLEIAVEAAAVLAGARYRELYAAQRRRRRLPNPRRLINRKMISLMKWNLLNGTRTKRILRNASHRPAVRRLRVSIWWTLMRPTSHRKTTAASELGTKSTAWMAGGRPGLAGIPKPRNGEPAEQAVPTADTD